MKRPIPLRDPLIWMVIVAILALVISILVPALVIARNPLLPLNQSIGSVSRAADAAVWADEHEAPTTAPVRFERVTSTSATEDPAVAEVATQVKVFSGDTQVAQTDDVLDVNRESAYPQGDAPVDFTMTFGQLSSGVHIGTESRNGLQYFFPAEVEKRSYPYFDPLIHDARPIDFLKESTLDGLKTYVFHQSLAPANIQDIISTLDAEFRGPALDKYKPTITGPASQFYTDEELAHFKLNPDTRVVLELFYSVDRDVEVEPVTGTILDVRESMRLIFATDLEQASDTAVRPAKRAVLAGDFAWDDASRAKAVAYAAPKVKMVESMALLGWAGKTLAAALGIIAGVLYLRRRRHA